MRTKAGFAHWVDGKHTWSLGVAGFFTRLRAYIISSVGVGLPLAGTPFWWPEKLPDKIEVTPVAIILWMLAFALCAFTLLFFYSRHRTQRSLEVKSQLHHLLNESREALLDLYERHSRIGRAGRHTPLHEKQHLIAYSKRAADTIARYFVAVTGDRNIGVVIRIAAATHQPGHPDTEYVTVARSHALNPGRSATTQPLPRSSGFPKFFLSSEIACKGVLFIDNIEKAIARGIYHRTPNDDTYKEDFAALAAIPITGWNGVRQDLIGILQITSQTHRFLHPKHVDLMRFSGDVLGVFFSSVFAKLLAARAMPRNLQGDGP